MLYARVVFIVCLLRSFLYQMTIWIVKDLFFFIEITTVPVFHKVKHCIEVRNKNCFRYVQLSNS